MACFLEWLPQSRRPVILDVIRLKMFDSRIGNYACSGALVTLIAITLLLNRSEFPPTDRLARINGRVADVRSGGSGSGVIELRTINTTKNLQYAWDIQNVFADVNAGDSLALLVDDGWVVAAQLDGKSLLSYNAYKYRRSRNCLLIVAFAAIVFIINTVAYIVRSLGVFGLRFPATPNPDGG